MTAALGRLVTVPLREVWSNEARDFTPWLAQAENLALLAETLGLGELQIQGREVPVGNFFIDILAKDIEGKLVLPKAVKPLRAALEKFANDVSKSLEDPNAAVSAAAKRYARAIEKGSNDKARRSLRHETLINLMTPYLKQRTRVTRGG